MGLVLSIILPSYSIQYLSTHLFCANLRLSLEVQRGRIVIIGKVDGVGNDDEEGGLAVKDMRYFQSIPHLFDGQCNICQ